MEDESCEYPTMEKVPCMGVAILDNSACVGTTVLDHGSHESSAILELGKVVGQACSSGHVLSSQVLHAAGSSREGSASEGHDLRSKGDNVSVTLCMCF